TVTVPAGTLPEGFDVNRLLPDRRAFTGAPGEVLAYVDENGGLHPLPWVVVGADELIFTTGIAADYRIVNAKGIFDDVMADDWYADSVAFVTARGLFSGTDEAVFSPDAPMTRGMLMTVLARLDGADTAGGSPWYKPGMDWAVTRGISDGSTPGAPITREQLAAMLWRYAGNPVSQGSLDGFTDAGKVSAYAAEALRWVVGAGLITGTDAGALNPQGEASRAEVSAMLTRFIMVKAE
ncbi:S-layer homology domain-containing protein, partial [Intestinimonas butyriciproducens]